MKINKKLTKEVNHNIGTMYELVLHNNLQLTNSVNDLKITIQNLAAAEAKLKDVIMAQQLVSNQEKLKAVN